MLTDGVNKTGKYANISTDWLPFYIYLAIGSQEHFIIEYRNKNLKAIKKVISWELLIGIFIKTIEIVFPKNLKSK